MRPAVARALVRDALYQVLDDKVFRVLAVVTGVLVLVPLMIAFRREEVVVLFGFARYSYREVFSAFGQLLGVSAEEIGGLASLEVREVAVDGYLSLLSKGLLESLGVYLCLAATAFFVPRMIEKGTADTVFSKPVSRTALLLARFSTGVLFVGMLSGALVVGTHVTLLLSSGYSDPAFLLAWPALVYKFALVYSVTALAGVVTRSSVAALVVSLMFFPFNGCVHGLWNTVQMEAEARRGLDEPEPEEQAAEPKSALDHFVTLLVRGFHGLHYALPKTGDAMTLAELVSDSLGAREAAFRDEGAGFSLLSLPAGFRALDGAGRADAARLLPPADREAVAFAAGEEQGARVVVVARAPRETPVGSSGRVRQETELRAVKALEDWIEDEASGRLLTQKSAEDPALAPLVEAVRPRDDEVLANGTPWLRPVRRLDWTAEVDGTTWVVRTLVREEKSRMLYLQLQAPAARVLAQPDALAWFGGRDFRFDEQLARDAGQWYAARLGWTAPWRFNAFFSLGSSLAFAALMLAVAAWRLSRIDF